MGANRFKRIAIVVAVGFSLAHTVAQAGDGIRRRNFIDDHIFGKMEKNGIPHAALASDAEFLRRIYLDLAGRLPDPSVVRAFLKDTNPDKRDKIIDSLFPQLPTMGIGRRPYPGRSVP